MNDAGAQLSSKALYGLLVTSIFAGLQKGQDLLQAGS